MHVHMQWQHAMVTTPDAVLAASAAPENHYTDTPDMIIIILQVDKEVDPTVIGGSRTLVKSMDEIKDQRTEQAKAQLRTQYGLKEDKSPMLLLSADLFR